MKVIYLKKKKKNVGRQPFNIHSSLLFVWLIVSPNIYFFEFMLFCIQLFWKASLQHSLRNGLMKNVSHKMNNFA